MCPNLDDTVVSGELFAQRSGWDSRYPDILDGQARRLIRGKHFEDTPSAFRNRLYKAASRRGLKVRTRITDAETILVQCFDPGPWFERMDRVRRGSQNSR